MTDTATRHPLPAAQAGIWAGQRLAPGDPMFNAGEYVDLRGTLDRAAFEAALRQTVGEAEALHARYAEDHTGVPHLVVHRDDDWPLAAVDLRPAADPHAAALSWMRAALDRPMDLTAGPPFRQALLRVADDRHLWFQQIHHIAADGYAFTLLARRVAARYTALVDHGPDTGDRFGPLAAVLAEDAGYRSSQRYATDRAFWLARQGDRPSPPTLTDRPAPARGAPLRYTTALPAEKLRAVAKQAGLAWSHLAIATFAAHLAARTDTAEVVLGLPVAGRLGSAALRVPCMWMNIVPLRVPVVAGADLPTVGRAVAAELSEVRPHSRYRYEQLRRDLGLVGGDRRLFGPVVNLLPFDHELRFAGLSAAVHNVGAGPVEDLSVLLHDRAGALTAEVDANPDSYHPEEVREHTDAWLALLRAGVEDPSRALGAPVRWLHGGPLPVAPRPVTELITARAAEDPEHPAVVHAGRTVGYGALRDAALRLAGHLAGLGAGPERPVAVALPRGIDAVVAVLAVLYAGAPYLPVDPDGPASRTAGLLADADPALVVTTPAYAALAVGRRRVNPVAAGEPSAVLPMPAPEQAAYVIYTSGSTGTPNGVVVEHGALAQFVAGATARYGIGRDDRVLQFAPLHFDASVEELFLTLCAGGTLVIRTDDMLDVGRLLAGCAAHDVTVLDLPTAYWHEVAYAVGTAAARLPSGLRTVIIGGEAASPARVQQWRAAVPAGVRLLNTYGPTEATVVATVADLSDPDGAPDIAIGTPLPGVRAAVVHGELYLAGGALARGYLHRPDRTAQRFVTLDGVRAYRTGDRVRLRRDGQLTFGGRVDGELKVSGHRVDPVEVESVLLRHGSVRDAAVVGVEAAGGGTRLVAHVVPADGATIEPAVLRAHCATALAAPVVPGRFVSAAAIPRTANGKLDRSALRDAAAGTSTGAVGRTGLEAVVADVWTQVLGVAPTGVEEDFFALGGQSLQTVQVSTRLSAALRRDVPVALVFRHPTVRGLAAALGDPTGTPTTTSDAGYRDDAVLGSDVVVGPARTTSARTVLLTGATGFVGRHLLVELLRSTTDRVICPVRAADRAEAAERLLRALAAAGGAPGVCVDRVQAVPADLTRPRLGLGEGDFADLADRVDAIFHSAAQVSVARDYASLRAVNVDGTHEVLRLAAAGRASSVHHISTVAVSPPGTVAAGFVDDHAGLRDGYQRSKWVAERLVAQAGSRGLPVSVYRLGRVTGPAGTATVNPDDLVWRLLRASVSIGALPDLDVTEPWTPADEVARAVVRLSASAVGVVNLLPARPVRLSALFATLRARGFDLPWLPPSQWAAAAERGEHAALAPAVRGAAHHRAAPPGPAAAAVPFAFSPVDQELLGRYLATAIGAGILPAPTAQASPTSQGGNP
nr:non-ribosomal peptide synthetase [uncultured bacterium]